MARRGYLQICWCATAVVALYVVIASLLKSPVDFTKQTLYADSREVIEVTKAPRLSFEESQNPRVVVFYSPYCPHCVRFRDTFQTVAQQTQEKHNQAEFYGVSCVVMSSVCRKFNISKYPTIVAIREGSPAESFEDVGQFMFSVSKVEKALGL